MTDLGCLATVNDGPEGIRLIENRVQLEACVAYNSEGLNGCPIHGPLPPPPPQ